MAIYKQETKDACVAAIKEGKSFKEIQQTLGPNPKAVQRYLAKAGINYKELKEELIASGKLKPSIKKNKSVREKEKATKAVAPNTKVIEE